MNMNETPLLQDMAGLAALLGLLTAMTLICF